MREATTQPAMLAPAATGEVAGDGNGAPSAPTAAQLTAIKAAIASAQTLAEVQQLEAALKSGRVPEGVLEAAADSAPTAKGTAATDDAAANDGAAAMDETS